VVKLVVGGWCFRELDKKKRGLRGGKKNPYASCYKKGGGKKGGTFRKEGMGYYVPQTWLRNVLGRDTQKEKGR